MKKLIIVIFLCFGFLSFAQEKPMKSKNENFRTNTPQEKNDNHVKKMVEELHLDSSQEQQLDLLFKDYQFVNRNQLSPKERKEFNKRLKTILTPDQLALMKANRK